VKLGPITLTYQGKASFIEKDEAAHRAVLDAQGRDARGNGTAAAKVTATLTVDGATATRVDVLTDLNITGKPAQFGRGVIADVGSKLIGQFADCLAGKLAGESPAHAVPEMEPPPVAPAERSTPTQHAEPVNLMSSAGAAVARRLAPVVAGVVLLVLIVARRRQTA
jgi:hypothetical protein